MSNIENTERNIDIVSINIFLWENIDIANRINIHKYVNTNTLHKIKKVFPSIEVARYTETICIGWKCDNSWIASNIYVLSRYSTYNNVRLSIVECTDKFYTLVASFYFNYTPLSSSFKIVIDCSYYSLLDSLEYIISNIDDIFKKWK